MKHSETPGNLKAFRTNYLDKRWAQLNGLVGDYADGVIKYLFLINSGGVVAIMSFMGTSIDIRNNFQVKSALFLFGVGILLVGCLKIFLYHKVEWIYKNWRKNSHNYLNDKIGWNKLIEDDNERSFSNTKAYLIGYGAFFAFLIGSGFGALGLIK
jgi:hypothetical protein